MFNNVVVILQLIASYGRGGVGLSDVVRETQLSRFIARKLLLKMVNDGLIVRQGNVHRLTLLGNNIVLGYEAAMEDFEVSVVKKSEWSYCFQRPLRKINEGK